MEQFEKDLKSDYVIMIEIMDGLEKAGGACQQLVHSHGNGNLSFLDLSYQLEAIKKAVTMSATIPMIHKDVKPRGIVNGFEAPDKFAQQFAKDCMQKNLIIGSADDQTADKDILLAEDACTGDDGDGIIAIDKDAASSSGGNVEADACATRKLSAVREVTGDTPDRSISEKDTEYGTVQ